MFVRYAIANLTRRKSRTIYAVIGIAISISVVVAVVSATRGVEKGIVSMLKQFRGDVLAYDRNVVAIDDSELDAGLLADFATLPGIREATGYAIESIYVKFHGFTPETAEGPTADLLANTGKYDVPRAAVPILAFPPDAFVFDRLETVLGRTAFSAPDAREVIVGEKAWEVARDMVAEFVARDGVDSGAREEIRERFLDENGLPVPLIHGEQFRFVGVYRTGHAWMDSRVIVPLAAFQNARGRPGTVNALVALLEPGADVQEVISRIEKRFPNLTALDPADLVKAFGNEYRKLQLLILVIAVLAGLGGAISVLNTMASNVAERTREIGLLRAVGWTRRRLIGSLLVEGALISTLGGLVGVGLGYIELELAEDIIGADPIPQGFEFGVFIVAMAISVGLGLLGSLLPAVRAARLTPVEALREE